MSLEEQVGAVALHLPAWSPVVAFFAPLFGGETIVLVLAFLAGQGTLTLWGVIVGSFFGMLTLDSFWFMVPRTRWAERLKERARVSARYLAIEARIESLSRRNDILVLFLSKVMIGTRILVLAYISVRTITFRRFFVYDAVATFAWAVILGYIGYGAGVGYYSLASAEHGLLTGALFVAGVCALFYALLWVARLWIIKK